MLVILLSFNPGTPGCIFTLRKASAPAPQSLLIVLCQIPGKKTADGLDADGLDNDPDHGKRQEQQHSKQQLYLNVYRFLTLCAPYGKEVFHKYQQAFGHTALS